MLTFFQVEKTYHKMTMRLHVDCARREADLTIAESCIKNICSRRKSESHQTA